MCKHLFFIKFATVLVLASLFGCERAYCQESSTRYSWTTDYIYRSYNRRFKPDFLKIMPLEEQLILRQVEFKIIPFADFNAFSNRDTKTILIPEGLLVFEYLIATAETFAFFKPEFANALPKYLDYLQGKYVEHEKSGKIVNIVEFPMFAKCDVDEYKRVYANEDFTGVSGIVYTDTIALIIAHELGHIVKGHKPYSEIERATSYKQEYEADEYAVNILNRAKTYQASAAAFTAFVFFAMLEGNAISETHPPAGCRIVRLCRLEIDYIKHHPDDWKDNGKQTLDSLIKMRDVAQSTCNE